MDARTASAGARRHLAGDPAGDARPERGRHRESANFERLLHEQGFENSYCLLHQNPANDSHELEEMHCLGISKADLVARLKGPNTLLNLSYSVHPPFLLQFERRLLCDLDPSEIFYWMTKMEMGQSHHHEFWTIGLNAGAPDCQLPTMAASLSEPPGSGLDSRFALAPTIGHRLEWKTFFPLADTDLLRPAPWPGVWKFTTIGQWYWGGGVEVDGGFPDLSKKFAFEQYLDLPLRVPPALFELAMNLNPDDPEIGRLQERGWRVVSPHRVARTPGAYRRYVQERRGRIHGDQGGGCRLANRLAERSRRSFSGRGATRHHRRHRRGEIPSRRERFSFCSRSRHSGNRGERTDGGLAAIIESRSCLRPRGLRFSKKSSPYSWPLNLGRAEKKDGDSPLQKHLRVLLVPRYG